MPPEKTLRLLVTLAGFVVLFILVALDVPWLLALCIAWIAWAAGLGLVGDE